MKNHHIILLVFIVAAISGLAGFIGKLSTYDTVTSAKTKPGKFVHLIAGLDHSQPVEYDPVKNPNYLTFTVIDSLGSSIKVVYHNAKPDNLEISDKLVLKGAIIEDHFECKEILMKCPSKYKDEPGNAAKNLPQ